MFIHGVQAELQRMRWELELREREAKKYSDALKTIRWAVENNAFTEISEILKICGL